MQPAGPASYLTVSDVYSIYKTEVSNPVSLRKFGMIMSDAFPNLVKTNKYQPSGTIYVYTGLAYRGKENVYLGDREIESVCKETTLKLWVGVDNWLLKGTNFEL